MKKAYLIIICIITIVCICIGSGYHVGKAVGFVTNNFKDGIKELPAFADSIKDFAAGFETAVSTDLGSDTNNKWTVKGAEKIDIDASVAEVVIKQGDVYEVTFEGKEKYCPDVTESGKELKIHQNSVKTASLGNVSLHNKITITIPNGTDLSKLEINCNVGDVEILNITSEKADIEASVGEVTIEGGKYDYLKVEANVGEIEIKEADVQEYKAIANVGDITIRLMDSIDNYNLDLSASIAEIEINGDSKGRSYKHTNGNAEKYIDATASVGSMEIIGK